MISTGRHYVPHSRSYARCFAPCLTPLDYYLRGAVKDKCYADMTEKIDGLQDNFREAIGQVQLHTIDNVLKYWTYRVGYCMAS